MSIKIVALSGSLSKQSRTRLLVSRIAQQAALAFNGKVDILDVAELAPTLGTALSWTGLPPAIVDAHQRLANADLLVIGSPVYKGSYSGLFKHLLDLADPTLLSGKAAILAATGGSDKHALVIEQHLRPLASFFELHTVPVGIFVRDVDTTAEGLAQASISGRISQAIRQAHVLLSGHAGTWKVAA